MGISANWHTICSPKAHTRVFGTTVVVKTIILPFTVRSSQFMNFVVLRILKQEDLCIAGLRI